MGKNKTIALGLNQLSAPAATLSQVQTEISNLVNSAPATLNTLKELSDALGSDANFSTTVTNSLALKAPLASPTFTGVVTVPTPINSTDAATKDYVDTSTAFKAPMENPSLYGNISLYDNGSPTLYLEDTYLGYYAAVQYQDYRIRLRNSGTDGLIIDYSGNISIGGDWTVSDKLHVNGTSLFKNAIKINGGVQEKVNIVASAPVTNIDTGASGQIFYFTSPTTQNFTINFRDNAYTSLNSSLPVGQSINTTILITNGATAYYPNVIQIDGTTVTPKWVGGTAPTSGDANAINIYSFNIIKTAANTYTVIAAKSKAA